MKLNHFVQKPPTNIHDTPDSGYKLKNNYVDESTMIDDNDESNYFNNSSVLSQTVPLRFTNNSENSVVINDLLSVINENVNDNKMEEEDDERSHDETVYIHGNNNNNNNNNDDAVKEYVMKLNNALKETNDMKEEYEILTEKYNYLNDEIDRYKTMLADIQRKRELLGNLFSTIINNNEGLSPENKQALKSILIEMQTDQAKFQQAVEFLQNELEKTYKKSDELENKLKQNTDTYSNILKNKDDEIAKLNIKNSELLKKIEDLTNYYKEQIRILNENKKLNMDK